MGAIIRGDTSHKKIALVFTGDEFADGGEEIGKILKEQKTKASFFLTGNFYRNANFKPIIKGLKRDGHYLGPHSDQHLLYCDWTKRDSLLITKTEFDQDLQTNYKEMAKFGIHKIDAQYFLPPYEWYNKKIAEWTDQLGLNLVNFTPGTRSNADYTYPEMGKSYRNSNEIFESIINYAKVKPNGLNGFILLMHIGTDQRRTDKFYHHLKPLIVYLKKNGYELVKINDLLSH